MNEYDPQHRLLLNVEAIAYHEGVPGHHLQISLAQEFPDLPEFRQHAGGGQCQRRHEAQGGDADPGPLPPPERPADFGARRLRRGGPGG